MTTLAPSSPQRIAIARALAGRPDLLLLDDCTASLDAQNEDRFWAELKEVTPDATVFLVSHRLATIRRADTILVLDDGEVIEHGPQADLRSDPASRYARLLALGAEAEVDAALLEPGAGS